MAGDTGTGQGRRVIHAISKVLLEMNGLQHQMGQEAFTAEVKRRAELELPGLDISQEKLMGLTDILMKVGSPRD